MSRKSTLVVPLFWALVASASAAMVTGCKFSPTEKAEKVARHVSYKLDLNEPQKAELKKLTELAVADFKAMSEDRKQIAAEVEKQISGEKADTGALKKLMTAQNGKRQELSDKWIDRLAEFHAKLSPEQKQKAVKMFQKFRERFESRLED